MNDVSKSQQISGNWQPSTQAKDDVAVTLSEDALKHVKQMLKKRGGGLGLRLGVTRSGCSGYRYVVDYVDELDPADQAFLVPGESFQVFVPRQYLSKLAGTQIDMQKQGLNHVFVYHNPHQASACGCGESFAVDDADE